MKKIFNLKYIAAGIILPVLLAGCDFLVGPGLSEGTISISFDSGGNGARAVSQSFIDTFRYDVTFQGPGGVLINRSVEPGTGSIRESLALGTWTISAEAYIPDGHLAGTGSVTIPLTSGDRAITVPMTLGMVYSLGEVGPGGLVFYDKGSYSNGWRYLEVSFTDLDPDTDNDDTGNGVKWCESSY
ncbi:MAG: hypothetical protein LBK08_04995, partial [Treponema sp.]|nr:hypothetical protein [Treponema sp.]